MASNGQIEKPEEQWQPARLIPVVGIRSTKEREQRATSALLAVMGIVPSFGKTILSYLDAPPGRISTFTEVHFEDDDGVAIPDGAIIAEWGSKRWVCLVEVKTGDSELSSEQVNRYMKIAVDNGFDAVLTISNQIVSSPEALPFVVNKRVRSKLKAVRHLSWFRILTDAVIKHHHHGVSDPEQAWILGQLIGYLDSEQSGAGGFDGMGSDWVAIRNAARQHTLRTSDKGVETVAADWMQFIEWLCLGLQQNLGREVSPMYPRKSTAQSRLAEHRESLGSHGKLEAAVRVPDAVAPITVEADLAARQVNTSVEVKAPGEGRAKTRVNWLLRQLKDAPADTRIDVRFPHSRETTSALITDARNRPETLLLPSDPKKEPRTFVVALTRPMGEKRGKGNGSFVSVTRGQVLDFYRDVVQNITAWQPRAPKLPKPEQLPSQSEQGINSETADTLEQYTQEGMPPNDAET